MRFRKDVTIYESKTVRVYINQCHNKGKKTNLFTVRRDDEKGCAHLLGLIKFDGGWRQYVFMPGWSTRWSVGCMQGIVDFCKEETKKWNAKWRKK